MSDLPLPNLMCDLQNAVAAVPAGRWGVGVSGGADSVALLRLLCERRSGDLHVIHLDHETRGEQSAGDAEFVADLAAHLGLPFTIARRSDVEAGNSALLANPSARFRQARLALFRRVVAVESLNGVLLAHHADDQAETVLQRLLRGAGPTSISGIKPCSIVAGVTVIRPLLNLPSSGLRDLLRDRNQPWREDSSNQSDKYLRNRLRRWLADRPAFREMLLQQGTRSAQLRAWLDERSPALSDRFLAEELARLPLPLARHASSKWLAAGGVPSEEINRSVCDRLIEMAADAASPPRRHFPGGVAVKRVRGVIDLGQ